MNQKILSLALCAFLLGLFSQTAFAQAAGTKPELTMYRYNSLTGGINAPVIIGDVLGTIRWDGYTGPNANRTGATIRSITKNTANGVLGANLVFSTSNGFTSPIPDRMIITETGLVGVGNMMPQYHLDVTGNTHTSGRFYGRIHMDVNPGDELPNTYIDEAYFERKTRAELGLGASTYVNGGMLTLAPGFNSLDRQLFFGDDAIWTRAQDAGGAPAWAAWQKLLTSGDISGTPNRIARFLPPGSPSSKIGDSQLFDDGTNVGIGTTTPDASYLLTVGGDARITGDVQSDHSFSVGDNLNVGGNTTLNGNANVAGNTLVSGNTTTTSLNVTNNSTTGSLQVNTNATVSNNCRVNGQLIVGNPPAAPGSHKLYVNGSAIAEEVVVKLQASWPDYVFEPSYDLSPLTDVEQFIRENKHLPGVASAREVATDGLELGKTQKAQMEKIEELYLHMIALEKRVKLLEAENAALKADNSTKK